MHIDIAGAGVAGLCAASALIEAGHTVTVYERAEAIGANASSWLAGGMLAPRCEAATAENAVIALGLKGKDWWRDHVHDVKTNGTLVVAAPRDRPLLEDFGRQTTHFEWQDKVQLEALEPDLAERFNVGLFYPEEAHLAPRHALLNLRAVLEAKGVRFVLGADAPDDDAGVRVDCTGWAARANLEGLRPVKGEMLILRSEDIDLQRPVRMLHPRQPIYVVPHGEGRFLVGATMIDSDDRHRVTARSVAGLINSAYALHPAFGEAEIVELGADIRPAFPDNLPRIVRKGQHYFINGLYRHGYLLAPAMAEMLAKAITDQAQSKEAQNDDHREWTIA